MTMKVNAKSGLNVRMKPGLSGEFIKLLSNDTIVTVYESKDGWSRIGVGQWVSAKFLILDEKDHSYFQLASDRDINYNDILYEQLKRDEGSRLQCYQCSAGKPTIGIGHNLQANYLPVCTKEIWDANPKQKLDYEKKVVNCWEGLVITEEQQRKLFNYDIEQCEIKLQEEFSWYTSLPDNQRCSLCNMCFNLGLGGLKGFVKMLDFLKAGEYEKAADEALQSKWAKKDVGARAIRVTRQMRTKSEV